jgi:hypothetical protein
MLHVYFSYFSVLLLIPLHDSAGINFKNPPSKVDKMGCDMVGGESGRISKGGGDLIYGNP